MEGKGTLQFVRLSSVRSYLGEDTFLGEVIDDFLRQFLVTGIEGESYDLGIVGYAVVVGTGCFFLTLRTGEHPVGQFGKPFLQLFAVLGSKCF